MMAFDVAATKRAVGSAKIEVTHLTGDLSAASKVVHYLLLTELAVALPDEVHAHQKPPLGRRDVLRVLDRRRRYVVEFSVSDGSGNLVHLGWLGNETFDDYPIEPTAVRRSTSMIWMARLQVGKLPADTSANNSSAGVERQ